jgi:uncharacterized membrane protein
MDDPRDQELKELRERLQELTQRVYRLERTAGVAPVPVATPEAGAPRAITPPEPTAVPWTSALGQSPAALPTARAHVPAPPPPRTPVTAPSLESRIGSQWLNRIGIVAVLFGVSYFLKYAFDNNWIGPAGRIAIGLLAGIAIVVWSEMFRTRGYNVFSYSLKAVGVGTLYLSLWAGFQLYHLFPAAIAFGCMVLVTAFTTLLALRQNAEILAAFALMGAFLTPVLVSTGQNREITLFSYVALLDVATVIFATQRRWVRLLPGAFMGTLLLYVGWYASYFHNEDLATTFFFATLFFLIFATPALFIRPTESDSQSRGVVPILTGLVLANAAVYFLEGFVMLQEWPDTKPFTAWFAIAVAAVYLLLARAIRSETTGKARELLTLLHVTLAIVFLTIAIPLKLEAHWVTIGWLVEAALIMYVGQRTNTVLLKLLAAIALALGVFRLVLFDNFNSTRVILNARFFTYVVAIGAIAFCAYLLRSGKSENERYAVAVAIVAINLLVLIAAHHEVNDYFNWQIQHLAQRHAIDPAQWEQSRQINVTRQFTYSAVWMLYGALLMWIGFVKRSEFLRWQALILIAATILKVFIYDVSSLDRGYRILAFIALGVILLGISFVYQRDWLKLARRGESA